MVYQKYTHKYTPLYTTFVAQCQYIRPGSIVYSDEWSSYNQLSASTGLRHLTVNHSLHFVGAHTQGVEAMWSSCKRMLREETQGKISCKFWHDSCMIFEPIRTLPVIFHVRCKTLHDHAWSCKIVRKSCVILARFSMILCKMACKIFFLGKDHALKTVYNLPARVHVEETFWRPFSNILLHIAEQYPQ